MSEGAREFFERVVRAIRPAPAEWLERLDEAGLETWQADPSPIDHVERSGAADPHSGYAFSQTEFEECELRPDAYPEDWPFLPGVAAACADVTGPDLQHRFLSWFPDGDAERVWNAIVAELRAAGWCDAECSSDLPDGVTVMRSRAFWNHPVHDAYRRLTWWRLEGDDPQEVVGLTDWMPLRPERAGDPPP